MAPLDTDRVPLTLAIAAALHCTTAHTNLLAKMRVRSTRTICPTGQETQSPSVWTQEVFCGPRALKMSNQRKLEHTTTGMPVRIRRRVSLSLASLHRNAPAQWSPLSCVRPYPTLVSTHPADYTTCAPQMNDMLTGGPALSGHSDQMGDTNDPVKTSDGEVKAVTATIMAGAMAADRAVEGEAGDAKVNMLSSTLPHATTPLHRWEG